MRKEIIVAQSGKHFDPHVVEAFLAEEAQLIRFVPAMARTYVAQHVRRPRRQSPRRLAERRRPRLPDQPIPSAVHSPRPVTSVL